jgi:hypothetical protein
MADLAPVQTTNLDGYGNPELPWERAAAMLRAGALESHASFLCTVRPDGTPHATRVGAIWHDGDLYFPSGLGTRKSRNLAANPAAVVAVSLEGLDLSLDGNAVRVTDPALLAQIADRYRIHGWPAEVAGDQLTAPYNAPSAGPAPWALYRFTFHTALGGATAEPYGATRWRFQR